MATVQTSPAPIFLNLSNILAMLRNFLVNILDIVSDAAIDGTRYEHDAHDRQDNVPQFHDQPAAITARRATSVSIAAISVTTHAR